MDGQYQNKRSQYREYLEKWSADVIQNRLWDKFVDLHVDEIDDVFKKKDMWIESSVFLYDILSEIVDRNLYSIVLAIPLVYKRESVQIPNTVEKLQKEVDITPPSFYLFPTNSEALQKTLEDANPLKISGAKLPTHSRPFYKEEMERGEYFRVVYIIR